MCHRWHLVLTVEEMGSCKPISVKMFNGNCVRYRSTADLVPEKENNYDTFWDMLEEGGGEWMWKFVDDKYKEEDMDWLREGMVNGMYSSLVLWWLLQEKSCSRSIWGWLDS